MAARGSVLTISAGDRVRGKPRPAVVVQNAGFDFPETLIVVPLSSRGVEANAATPLFQPDDGNKLESPSYAMIQRMGAVEKTDVGEVVGNLADIDMQRLDAALALVLGLDVAWPATS